MSELSSPTPVAVVTGATDGIGRATAMALTARGWRVGVLGRNQQRVADVVDTLNADREASAFPVVADLTSMTATRHAALSIRAATDRLDLLALNANHITQEHVVTPDGFEANLAIGWLSRVLLMRSLEPLLQSSGGQVFSVIGLNLSPLDSDDLSLPGSPGGMKALGQWQWAMQTYLRAWNSRSSVPANNYMPGIVKTKILDDEPGRLQRIMVKAAMTVMARTPEQSAELFVTSIESARKTSARDHYFSGAKDKGVRNLRASAEDIERVWELGNQATQPWLA